MPKRLNPNLVKIHRNYTVEEVAEVLSVHKNSVRLWIKDGLPICDDKRPLLILGAELRVFLQTKRKRHKRECKSYEIYCMRCKAKKRPAENMVDLEYSGSTRCLVGLCPDCGCVMNKFIKEVDLEKIKQELDVSIPESQKHINKSF